MSAILVTGGSGFIGSGLVKALLRTGNRVRVLDDNSRGHPRRLADVAKDVEFIVGDIRDAAAVEEAARGMDEVHHLAPSSTARNSSTTRQTRCSTSACAACST